MPVFIKYQKAAHDAAQNENKDNNSVVTIHK